MEEPERIRALLEEIRDLQKEHLVEYRAQASRSIQIAEDSVRRQAGMISLYKRVLIVAAILIAVLAVWMWQTYG